MLELQSITKTFQSGNDKEMILKGIDVTIPYGEVTALVGASGSGKSTLLTIANGLQDASSGKVLYDGENLLDLSQEKLRAIRATEFGFVFQFSYLVPFLTVEEQLHLMLDVAESTLSKRARQAEVDNLLERVEMDHRKNAYPASLSGGEKQRVAIARALIHRPSILFADEPTASLDSKKSAHVMGLIQKLTKAMNIATLVVTHDEDMLAFADRIVTMKDGEIMAEE
ncbi:ABC transporter ATP-binding protein [Paenisporosarcina cavernae]|uniref:Putative hemin import ATP-binding protein HrtA n=1 Tax=Paenisporosarcina cavernae TaxID=2320858 RepID=A0A385YP67_9BACL|nr:ABC transporter ATP-binding protein [Paenisporosarcina cavernae]AYC28475.1 ABC transporter ATP-binding protein [Paenisporosarcina cavernae]